MKYGVTWEPDPMHAELIISQLDLQNAKPLEVPGTKEEKLKKRLSGRRASVV